MPTLDELKAAHPEWCFNCGYPSLEHHDEDDTCPFTADVIISALLAKAREDEARIEANVQHMVNRFLGWKLPEDFAPDAGISFDIEKCRYGPNIHFPIGTNLFTATQTEAMIRYMLEEMPHE